MDGTGQTAMHPRDGQQQLHHVFATSQYGTCQLIWLDAPLKNTDTFIQFLELLMASLDPAQSVVIVLDNAPCSCSVAAQAVLVF